MMNDPKYIEHPECRWALFAVLILLSTYVFAEARLPAGFDAQGSALNEYSDWVVNGSSITAAPGAVEWTFPPQALPVLTENEKQQGYVLYTRHYMDMVHRSSRPQRAEIGTRRVIFATPGEYEPVTFSLFALQPLEDVTPVVSDLVSPSGDVIPAENIDVRVVNYLVCTREGQKTPYHYEPLVLERKDSFSVSSNETLRLWLTVHVPSDAKPTVNIPGEGDAIPGSWEDEGVSDSAYTGVVGIRVPGRGEVAFELKLVVLPFKLSEPDRLYGMCYLPNPYSRGLFPHNMDKHMVDMREHGMNSVWTWPDTAVMKDITGRTVWDFEARGLHRKDYGYYCLDEIVASYVGAGFTNLWICGSMDPLKDIIPGGLGYRLGTPEFSEAYLAFVAQLRQHATRKGWPPYCLHPIDEPGGQGNMQDAMYYYDLINEHYPEEITYADLGPWHGEDEELIPRCDILCLAIPNPENTQKVLDAGKELWMYNCGSFGHDPKSERLSWGLVPRKIGVKGVFQWVYQWWWEDSVKGGFPAGRRYTQPSAEGPVPMPGWEAVREGIDDDRYAQTLQDLAVTVGMDDPVSLEAIRALNAILKPVPGGSQAISGGDHPALGAYRGDYLAKTQSIEFDRYRWQLAKHILALMRRMDPSTKKAR